MIKHNPPPTPINDDLLSTFKLAIAGALGKHPLKSLLINLDHNKGDLAEAFQDATAEMDLQPNQIDVLKTRIVVVSIPFDRYTSLRHRLIKKHEPDLIFTA